MLPLVEDQSFTLILGSEPVQDQLEFVEMIPENVCIKFGTLAKNNASQMQKHSLSISE